MQTIFFGVIDPLGELGESDAGVRGLRYEELDGLCAMCRQQHMRLEWRYEALVAVPLTPSEPVDILGITIAFAPADISAGAITDLIDLRQLRGLTQAIVDWQVVRLAAAALGIALGDGQLFIVQEEGKQQDNTPLPRDRDTPVLTVRDVDALLAQTIPGDGEVPELDAMVYPDDAVGYIEEIIQAEAAAYADDHGDDPPDPEAAFRAQRRLRSLHLALGLIKLVEERMQ